MDFIKKVAIVVLFIIVILIPNSTFSVLLMVLAAAIIALYFHGLAGLITRKIKLPGKWSMFFSILGTFGILLSLFWLIGSKVQTQVADLSEKLPVMVEQAKSQLNQYSWGRTLLDQTSTQRLLEKQKRGLSGNLSIGWECFF